MRTSQPNGTVPYVWDQNSDVFDSTQMVANWDALDAAVNQPRTSNAITQIGSLPTSLNNTTDRGKLYFLTSPDQGFATGTIVRWSGSAWNDVSKVEVMSTLPTQNNYDGRLVLLSATTGGFQAWTLVRYLTGSWYTVNQGIETSSIVPVSNNFAGRVVILTSASGAFNAYDVIRYDGSAYKLVGPQPIPPATELAYYAQTVDLTTTNTVSPGDTISGFSAATFENVKYYFEVNIPRLIFSVTGDIFVLLQEATTTIGGAFKITNTGIYDKFTARMPFTPTAGSHTYNVKWYVSTAGTATINVTGLAPATFRIVKG